MNSKSNNAVRILFIISLMIMPLLLAPTTQAEKPLAGEGLTLDMFLTDDGRLNLPPEGILGNIDPTGYTLANGSGKAPRFVPTDAAESTPSELLNKFQNNKRVTAVSLILHPYKKIILHPVGMPMFVHNVTIPS